MSRLNIDHKITIVGVAVARVRMATMTYAAVLQGAVTKTNVKMDKLKGVIVDWATAQIEGLNVVAGEKRTEKLLRGCQLCYSFPTSFSTFQ